MTPEELAENAFQSWFAPGSDSRERMIAIVAGIVRDARLEALEEAAKIADMTGLVDPRALGEEFASSHHKCAKAIAAAIRERAKT